MTTTLSIPHTQTYYSPISFSDRLDSSAPFTGPAGIASISGGKYLVIASATAGSPLFSLSPSENFYRQTLDVSFPINFGDGVHFLSNYDNTSFFLGQDGWRDGETDIFLVDAAADAAKPYARVHQLPTVKHDSRGLVFFPIESKPSDDYNDLASEAAKVGEGVCVALAAVVCVWVAFAQ